MKILIQLKNNVSIMFKFILAFSCFIYIDYVFKVISRYGYILILNNYDI